MNLNERSEEYAKAATPFAWQRTAIAAMFREVYAMACGDAAKVAREKSIQRCVGHQKSGSGVCGVEIAAAIEALASPARGGAEASEGGK